LRLHFNDLVFFSFVNLIVKISMDLECLDLAIVFSPV
jgi:hypothetical protein